MKPKQTDFADTIPIYMELDHNKCAYRREFKPQSFFVRNRSLIVAIVAVICAYYLGKNQ